MGTGLTSFWCKKCRKRVCEALPRAAVWCACGRRAKPVPEVTPGRGRRPPDGKVGQEAKVQIGLPL